MMPSTITQRLIWKSLRQSISLVVTLFLLVVILSLLTAFLSRGYAWTVARQMMVLIPILYSVGAGTVLVSFDRDTRAIDWLKSLPVRWHQVAFAPIFVAVALLSVLWFLMWAFELSINSTFGRQSGDQWLSGMIYITSHSFYLLLCGFTSAWIFRSPLIALLGIVPLAAIPAIIEYARQEFVRGWSSSPNVRYIPDLPMPIALGLLAVCALGMIVATASLSRATFLSERQDITDRGLKSFIRNATEKLSGYLNAHQLNASRPTVPLTRMSTLLWGFYRENRGIFRTGQLAVFVFAGCLFYINETSSFDRGHGVATVVAFITGIILLTIPVVTFQADANRDRVRFLTERGVRPSELWWSRQLIIIGIVCLFILVMTFLSITEKNLIPNRSPDVDSWALMVVLVFNAYALSQWVGQVVHRVTIAIVISLVAVAYISNWIVYELPDLWSIVLSDIVLLVATYRMMLPWMERRIDWRYWLGHAKYAVMITVILLPLPWIYYTAVNMFSQGIMFSQFPIVSWRGDWEFEAQAAFNSAPPEIAFVIREDTKDASDETNEQNPRTKDPIVPVEEKLRLLQDSAQRQGDDFYESLVIQVVPGGVYHFDPGSFYSTYDLVMQGEKHRIDALHPLTLNSDNANAAFQQKYVRWVQLMVDLTKGLRKSHHLFSQEMADQYEIWLIKQCLDQNTQRLIDDVLFDAICELVGDPKRRWESRRRALLVTQWRQRREKEALLYPSFLPMKNGYPSSALGVLVDYIEAAKQGQGEFPAETLAELSGMEPEYFGIGEGADWIRVQDASKHGFPLGVIVPVAMFWGADWEKQGERLRELTGVNEPVSLEALQ